jgi:hypothetical protein
MASAICIEVAKFLGSDGLSITYVVIANLLIATRETH